MYQVNIKEEKKRLRKRFKTLRLGLSPVEKEEKDKKILERVQCLWSFKEAETIFIYVSTEIEVATKQLILNALRAGKQVAVPYCIENTSEMDFYFIKDYEKDLAVRTFGVMEPKPERCEKVMDFSSGICFVPALAYDAYGYRLGYGKGYYDRFLSRFHGTTAGLIYADCVTERLPHGRFDQRVDLLISEKFVKPTLQD